MEGTRKMRFANGRAAYEEELRRLPLYHDGAARPSWDALPEYARWSWSRNPTQREPHSFAMLKSS